MKKELDLKTIDSKEKAFLIGATSLQIITYWKDSKELLAKNILRVEWCLASFNDDSFKGVNQKEIIKNWFIRNFGDYIDKIEVTDFFLPEHRAEMLMMLCPNKKFITVAKIKIKKLYEFI